MIYVGRLFPTPPGAWGNTGRWPYPEACHLLADTEDELDLFALELGLRKSWKAHPGTYKVHYDLTKGMRVKAIKLGAKVLTFHEEGLLLKRLKERKTNET